MAKKCSSCGRGKQGHPKPFGKKCQLEPISPGEDETDNELLADDEAAATAAENTETELESGSEGEDLDRLLAQREELLQEQAKAKKEVKAREAKLRLKEKSAKMDKLKKEIADLKASIQEEKTRLVVLNDALDNENNENNLNELNNGKKLDEDPVCVNDLARALQVVMRNDAPPEGARSPRDVPQDFQGACGGACGGARPKVRLDVQPRTDKDRMPPPDHSVAAYARAYAAAAGNTNQGQGRGPRDAQAGAGIHGNANMQPQPRAEDVLNANPLLAAACGGNQGANQGNQRPFTDGKSVPETFIYKPGVTSSNDRISFYDFMQGVFRMLMLRLLDDGLPIDDRLVYFESIAAFATNYRWSAVFELHQVLSEEVRNGRRRWDDPIPQTLITKYLNADTLIHDRNAGDSRKSRKDSVKRDGANRERVKDSDSSRERGTCHKFNENVTGCPYGSACKFNHICSECEKRGVEAKHPAFACPYKGSGGGGGGSGGHPGAGPPRI